MEAQQHNDRPGPAWYRDPRGEAAWRYWDGTDWTEDTEGDGPGAVTSNRSDAVVVTPADVLVETSADERVDETAATLTMAESPAQEVPADEPVVGERPIDLVSPDPVIPDEVAVNATAGTLVLVAAPAFDVASVSAVAKRERPGLTLRQRTMVVVPLVVALLFLVLIFGANRPNGDRETPVPIPAQGVSPTPSAVVTDAPPSGTLPSATPRGNQMEDET